MGGEWGGFPELAYGMWLFLDARKGAKTAGPREHRVAATERERSNGQGSFRSPDSPQS